MGSGLVDVHAHLTDPKYDADRPEVTARAREAGLVAVVNAGTDLPTSRMALSLAEADPLLWALVGVHPHDASTWSDSAPGTIRELLQHPRCLGVGECGLDYHYDFSPRDVQRRVFETQWDLAATAGVPVVVHVRKAFDDFFSLIDGRPAPSKVMLHCFSGDLNVVEKALKRGFSFSFGGMLTFKNGDEAREVCAAIPLPHVHLETDCPWMTPLPFPRRDRNEPALLAKTLETFAHLHGQTPEVTADALMANALTFFGDRFRPG